MQFLAWTVCVGCALLAGSSAASQSADRSVGAPSACARASVALPPLITSHNSGSTKAILVPFGPYITQTGVGAGGADVSELYTTFTLGAVGYNIFGYGMQASVNIRVADDFTVPAAQSWTVSGIKWLTYQTGAATTGTITGCNINLWNTNPNGQLPGGQSTTGPANVWLSNSWTGVYRVADSSLTTNNRAIIQASCQGAWVPVLGAGSYWLDSSFGGTLTSGPWSPPKTKVGQVPPTGDPWNGLQSVSAGAFAQVYDTGNPLGSINEPGDFLWQVEGTSAGSVTSFCTSKTSSLGCTPTLTASSSTASKTGTPPSTLTASPVPGGAGLPGILIYAKTAPVAPIVTSFGFLCLSGFQRAGAFPASPGGTPGTCSGAYTWDVAVIAAGTASILVGDMLRIQAWYRDPGFPPPGNANFTNGVNALTVTAGAPTPPTVTGVSPSSGGEGTTLTVTGSGFGTNPNDLRILLADGNGFADVSGAIDPSTGTLTATVFKVGNTGVGPVTVILGTDAALPGQSSSLGTVTSNSSFVRALTNGAGTNFGSFSLSPASANTVSVKSGSPFPGGISLDLTGITGNGLVYRLSIKFLSGEFAVYQGRIDFTGVPSTAERASHLADHLNKSFGSIGVSASASGSSVRVSMAGAAYGGIVVAGT
jgi:IPT/TIG domain